MFFVPIPRAIAIERGLKSYFSNKPCKRGLISSRLVSNKSHNKVIKKLLVDSIFDPQINFGE